MTREIEATSPPEAAAAPPERDAAVRLIDFTGERCVPWVDHLQMIYEHLHRYLFASRLVSGRRVLDLASGEGYGADLLANVAAQVVGVELEAEAVEHATRKYARSNLHFQQGSMLELSGFEQGSFDVVTCFEALEHVTEHEELLAAIDHVLSDDGVLLISTPDRHVYTELLHSDNPFHVRELDAPELMDLLHTRFKHVRLFGQRFVTGSIMEPLDAEPDDVAGFTVVREGETWRSAAVTDPTYLIGVASRRDPGPGTVISWLDDLEHRIVGEIPEMAVQRENVIRQMQADVAASQGALAGAVAERTRAEGELAAANADRARLEQDLTVIRNSKGWRAVLAGRQVIQGVRERTTRR